MGASIPQLGSYQHALLQKSKGRLLSSPRDLESWGNLYNEFADDPFEDDGCSCFRRASRGFKSLGRKANNFAVKGWEFARSDPRRIVFAGKFGLALTLISLLTFLREPFADIGRHSLWAILTIILMFEFTVGSTLSKGFSRAIGTLSAGGLALGVACLCTLAGELEEIFIIISIFITGFLTAFIKLYPTMKPYEYGFRVFLLTFCIVMVSGNRMRQFVDLAVGRFFLIAIGAAVGFGVNICIYPIWAGEDLHNVVVKNFMGVAKSLEGCVNGYLQCVVYERIPSKILTYQASDDPLYSGYRSAVESKSQEDTLLGFAIWEPPHGPYKMLRYPWKNYVKVSGALRYCSFSVMALHGCILSEIQAPPERRQVFSSELQRVGIEGAKVLREIGDRIKTMRKLSTEDILCEVHEAAEELQNKIDRRSYLLVNAESWEIGGKRTHPDGVDTTFDYLNIAGSEAELGHRSVQLFSKSWDAHNPSPDPNIGVNCSFRQQSPTTPKAELFKRQISWPARKSFNLDEPVPEEECKTYESASALSLATFASLLIEFVARLQNVVNAFEELALVANFKDCVDEPVIEDPGLSTKLLKVVSLK